MIKAHKSSNENDPVAWLPIDSRLFPPIFSFGRVKGVAKFFLVVEMFLSLLVVLGTFVLVVLYIFA